MIVYARRGYNSKQTLNTLRHCATCRLCQDCEIDLNFFETGKQPKEWNDSSCSKWEAGTIELKID